MKKLSKKGVLLFAAAMALCAFAMPSMASAASWTVVGSHHTLDSPNVGFETTNPVLGTITSTCTASSFTVTVSSSTDARITAATFGGHCSAVGPGIGVCTTDATAQALPWTATAISTTNVQIHGIDVHVTFTQGPAGSGTCNIPGSVSRITGTLTGATWDEARREINMNNSPGLAAHTAVGVSATTAHGTFRDTQQTLTMHH